MLRAAQCNDHQMLLQELRAVTEMTQYRHRRSRRSLTTTPTNQMYLVHEGRAIRANHQHHLCHQTLRRGVLEPASSWCFPERSRNSRFAVLQSLVFERWGLVGYPTVRREVVPKLDCR